MKKRSHPPPELGEVTQAQHTCQVGALAPMGHQPDHLSTSVHLFEFPCFETLEVAASEILWGRMSTGARAQIQSLQSRPLTWAQRRSTIGSKALSTSQRVAGRAH